MKKAFFGILLIALAAAAAVFVARQRAADEPPVFITAEAVTGPIEHTVLASGALEPARLVTVGARASGQVVKLHVKMGERVRAGQLIAEIDSQPQRNTLSNAEAALQSAKAQRTARQVNLRQAERVYLRQRNLFQADAASRDAFETAEAARDALVAEIAALDAQIRQAAAAVETARTDLGYTRIVAPIDGVVVAVVTEEGRTVNAFQSAPAIVMLAQLDVMRVKAEISEADVTRVRPGQPVWFTVLGEPGKRYRATLQAVEPAPAAIVAKAEQGGVASASQSSAASKTAVYYNGLFELPNPDGELRPLMTAQVHILLAEVADALSIPVAALAESRFDGVNSVRVVDARGRAAARRIETGLNNGLRVQVLSGLRAGERVVVGDAAGATPGGSNWGN